MSPWVFWHFVNQEFVYPEVGEYVVFRTEPMTQRCNPNYSRFWKEAEDHLEDFSGMHQVRHFTDGEVSVFVFRNE